MPFTWVKLNPSTILPTVINVDKYGIGNIYSGLGSYTNGNQEEVLLARRGKTLERQSKSVKQVIFSPRGRHSEKPTVELHRRIFSLLGDLPRLEMFARTKLDDGWDYWGNEIESDINLYTKGNNNNE